MNQQDKFKREKEDDLTFEKAETPKVATNPNPRANENLKSKNQQVTHTSPSSSSEINSEITDGEDA
ncbi:MAG: hypothetical protein ACM3VS_00785 [Candidatus Dadabacteria bacterium]